MSDGSAAAAAVVSTMPGRRDPGPLVELSDVEYTYPTGVQAVQNVSLPIGDGEIVGLIGPSGCGKSTILSLIAGLIAPGRGAVRWNGERAKEDRTRRDLTMVFQTDTLMPWLTVEKNVGFGLRYLDLGAAEKRERVTELLALAGLEKFRNAYPRELSGGMRRRVAFLAGVAPLPRVLLLDEPFAALDEPTRVAIHGEVLRIVRRLAMTVVLVTHDLAEAITLCDVIHVFTRRPATVATSRAIRAQQDDDVRAIRETREFHDVYRELWHELNLQIEYGHTS